jgi:HK97 family phage portal protein
MYHVPIIPPRPRSGEASAAGPTLRPRADVGVFYGLQDPKFYEFLREGGGTYTFSGVPLTTKAALKNPTVIRCVSLISFSIGMLPLHLRDAATKEKADSHPLFRVLHRKPNAWQTAFEFRSLLQQRALVDGDAFARIVRSRGNVMQLVPLRSDAVTPRQRSDWQIEYEFRRPDGGTITLGPEDVFHLRYGLSEDGIRGLSLVKQAAEAIGIAIQTDNAAARLFRHGMMVGGALQMPDRNPHISDRGHRAAVRSAAAAAQSR